MGLQVAEDIKCSSTRLFSSFIQGRTFFDILPYLSYHPGELISLQRSLLLYGILRFWQGLPVEGVPTTWREINFTPPPSLDGCSDFRRFSTFFLYITEIIFLWQITSSFLDLCKGVSPFDGRSLLLAVTSNWWTSSTTELSHCRCKPSFKGLSPFIVMQQAVVSSQWQLPIHGCWACSRASSVLMKEVSTSGWFAVVLDEEDFCFQACLCHWSVGALMVHAQALPQDALLSLVFSPICVDGSDLHFYCTRANFLLTGLHPESLPSCSLADKAGLATSRGEKG